MSKVKLYKEQECTIPRCDKSSIYQDDDSILYAVHCDGRFVPLEKGLKDAIVIRGQDVNTTVGIGDPVYLNKIIQKRDLPTGNRAPLGVYIGGGTIVLKGVFNSQNITLVPGKFYFKNNVDGKLALSNPAPSAFGFFPVKGGGVVHKVNLSTGAIAATFTLPGVGETSPYAVHYNGGFLYISNENSPLVYKVDANTMTLSATGSVGTGAGLMLNVMDGKLYVGNDGSGYVDRLDAITMVNEGQLTGRASTSYSYAYQGRVYGGCTGPSHVEVSLALTAGTIGIFNTYTNISSNFLGIGDYIYVGAGTRLHKKSITEAINITPLALQISAAGSVQAIANEGNYLYVVVAGNSTYNGIYKVDLTTFALVGAPVLIPTARTLTINSGFAYVGTTNGTIVKINLTTFTNIGTYTIAGGANWIGFSDDFGDIAQTTYKVGFAQTPTKLLVDIDVEGTSFSSVFSAEEINPNQGTLYDFTFSPDMDEILCSSFSNNGFCRFNAKTNQYMGFVGPNGTSAYGMSCRTKAGENKVYTGNHGTGPSDGGISIYNVIGGNYVYVTTLITGYTTNRGCYSETSDKIYHGRYQGGIYRLNGRDNALATVSGASSYGCCRNSQMDKAYFNSESGSVGPGNQYITVVNCATDTVVKTISSVHGLSSGVRRCVYNPVNNCVYASGSQAGVVFVIDCNTDTVVKVIGVPGASSLYGIGYFSPNNFIYVTAISNNFIGVIDCATDTYLKTLTAAMLGINLNEPKGMLFKDVYEKIIFNNNGLGDVGFLSY